MTVLDSEFTRRSALRSQFVRDQPIRRHGVFLQEFAHEPQLGVLVSLRLHQHVEDLPLGINRAPQLDYFAFNSQVEFVQMPDRMWPITTVARYRRFWVYGSP